jgi:branched-chain amino acid aminotransferase
MTEPLVFLNGDFMPASEAKLNIFDLGLIMGATFTEMTRTFSHAPFRLEDHISRLFRSLRYGGIEIPFSPAEVLDLTQQLIEHNAKLIDDASDLAIVHFMTPGENRIYAGTSTSSTPLAPTVCIHSFPLPFHNWRNWFETGAHVVTPSTRHIPPQCVDPQTKNRSRLHWWLAEREAKQVDPHAISLLLDLNGNITECVAANFLIVKNRTVFSPTSRNILGGISLRTVRELCAELGLDWIEKDLQIPDVMDADEAWLTSTSFCIAPAMRINGAVIGGGKIGPLFDRVLGAWSARVKLDIRAQIMNAEVELKGRYSP